MQTSWNRLKKMDRLKFSTSHCYGHHRKINASFNVMLCSQPHCYGTLPSLQGEHFVWPTLQIWRKFAEKCFRAHIVCLRLSDDSTISKFSFSTKHMENFIYKNSQQMPNSENSYPWNQTKRFWGKYHISSFCPIKKTNHFWPVWGTCTVRGDLIWGRKKKQKKKTDWSIQHIYEEEETIKKLFSQAAFPFDMSRYCTVGRWCCCPWYHQSAKVFHPFWHRQGTHQSPSEYKWYSFWCHIINLPSLLTMTGHTPKSIWIQILQLLMPRHQWEATWKTLLFL